MLFIKFAAPDGATYGVPLSVVIKNCAEDRVGGGASDVQIAEIANEFRETPQAAVDWAIEHMDFDADLQPHIRLLSHPAPVDLRSVWLAVEKAVIEV